MREYRPIDSVPHDGRPVFVVDAGERVPVPATVCWRPKTKTAPAGWYFYHVPVLFPRTPTHWANVNWITA